MRLLLLVLLAWALLGWLAIAGVQFFCGHRRLGHLIRQMPQHERLRAYATLLTPPTPDVRTALTLLVLGPLAAVGFWQGLNDREDS